MPCVSVRGDHAPTPELLHKLLTQRWEFSPVLAVFPEDNRKSSMRLWVSGRKSLTVVYVYGAGDWDRTSYWLHTAPRRHLEGRDWEEPPPGSEPEQTNVTGLLCKPQMMVLRWVPHSIMGVSCLLVDFMDRIWIHSWGRRDVQDRGLAGNPYYLQIIFFFWYDLNLMLNIFEHFSAEGHLSVFRSVERPLFMVEKF